jgi:putative DNA primase/helicase
VFVAWTKAADEREWSNKGLAKAMAEKGYEKKASDGMQWLGLRLTKEASDFVDKEGRPVKLDTESGDDRPASRAYRAEDDDDDPFARPP